MDKPFPTARFVRTTARNGKRLQFHFENVLMEGFEGETVLTALLCNTDYLRQFEFSEAARAGFCIMAACQDCWVWCDDGTRLRACTTPLIGGMRLLSTPPMAGRE